MSPLEVVPFGGADYFLIRMTDFGVKNCVFELKIFDSLKYFGCNLIFKKIQLLQACSELDIELILLQHTQTN